MKRVFFLGLTLLLSLSASAQNWPQFRGPKASGVAEGHPTATKWNAETGENILWKTTIPGLSHASPIVWGDRVFLTTAISSAKKPTSVTASTATWPRPKICRNTVGVFMR